MDIGVHRLKRLIARDLGVPFQAVTVYGVGHHGIFYTKRYDGPFWVKIIADGQDITKQYPNQKLMEMYRKAGYAGSAQFEGAPVDQMRTAVSFLNNVLAIYYDTKKLQVCVPGPNGLPGSYPVRLSAEGAEVVLPGITLEEAIRINEDSGKLDGIEKIKDDGTVVFLDQNVEYMRQIVGYKCKELKLEESEERAKELGKCLKRMYEKYKVG